MNSAHYQIRKGSTGKFYFVLVAPNNEIIGSSKVVPTKDEIYQMINRTRICCTNIANYIRKSTLPRKWPYFLLQDETNKNLIKSEIYTKSAGSENGIQACMEYGPTEKVIDKTLDA